MLKSTTITVGMRHTDAAGVIFFPRLFELCQETLENALEEIDFPLKRILEDEPFLLPVVNAKADYCGAIRVGDKLEIAPSIGRIGASSITINYIIQCHGETMAKAEIIHAVMDKVKGVAIEIPDELKKRLA